jgi:GNAT superfamily N-acetyltransferase
MLTIRKVDTTIERNRALLHWLQLEALPGDVPMETEEGQWWIAYEDTNPIGFCGAKRSSRWSDTVYLCRAGVLRAFRGKGIQKKLIRIRVNYARREGFTWMISDTFYNPASANSLINCGFKMFNPTNPWSFKDACYWRKRL